MRSSLPDILGLGGSTHGSVRGPREATVAPAVRWREGWFEVLCGSGSSFGPDNGAGFAGSIRREAIAALAGAGRARGTREAISAPMS